MDLQTLGQCFRPKQGLVLDRIARIKREGSPVYSWTPGVINAGATAVIEVGQQFPASRKYAPLDSIELVNNETANDLMLTINGGDQRYCPAGTIRQVHGRGVALWHIAITNNGAVATTAGLVRASLQKEAMTIDRWAGDQP